MKQTEYLEGVLSYYRENDIQQGDPNEGKWEEAHTPLPRGKGDTTVLLLHHHHVVHDFWQSMELDEYHFLSGDAKKVLYGPGFPDKWFQLCDIYHTYAGSTGRKNVESGHLSRVRDPSKAGAGNKGTSKPWAGKNTNSQRWVSLVDGYISTAAGVVHWHRKRGWDPSLRVHLSP